MMNHPKKVLFIGGPDVNARIPLMQQLDDFQITALGSKSELKEEFDQAGFEYYTYPLDRGTNPIADISTLFLLTRLCRYLQPDIVHTFDNKIGVWGRLAANFAGVPVIIGTLPGLGGMYNNDSFSNRLIRSIYQPLQKQACAQSDLTIFQNHDDAHHFVNAGVVSENKVGIILGSGVDTDRFSPSQVTRQQKNAVRELLGILPNQTVVTMISRVIRSKGVLEFMAAAQQITHQFPNTHFLLIGPDDHESLDRLDQTQQRQLKQTVTWPGSSSDIPVILAVSDIFVFPSHHREGIPRVSLEAASMGLPIVTTDAPGCKEVVEDGVNGFLIPQRDIEALVQAILHLMADPDMRRHFGMESRMRAVMFFDLSVIAEQTRRMYWRLLNRKGLLTTENNPGA